MAPKNGVQKDGYKKKCGLKGESKNGVKREVQKWHPKREV